MCACRSYRLFDAILADLIDLVRDFNPLGRCSQILLAPGTVYPHCQAHGCVAFMFSMFKASGGSRPWDIFVLSGPGTLCKPQLHGVGWGEWGYVFCLILYCISLFVKLIQVLTYALLWISQSSSTIIRPLGVDQALLLLSSAMRNPSSRHWHSMAPIIRKGSGHVCMSEL